MRIGNRTIPDFDQNGDTMIQCLERPQSLTTHVARRLTVKHPAGLHARASGAIVTTVDRFTSKVQLCYGGHKADASGNFDVLMLAVPQGAEVIFEAERPDAEQVLDALSNLFADDFGLSDN